MKANFKITLPIVVFLLSLELFMRLYGSTIMPENKVSSGAAYPILTLGESTTQKMPDLSDWPNQLQSLLNKNYQAVVYNEGLAATATPTILYKVPGYIQKYHPKLIITMMGINDTKYFWPKKFIVSDENDIFLKIKTVKLFRYLMAELKEMAAAKKDWVEPNIDADSLGYNGMKELTEGLSKAGYKSKEYAALLQKIEQFLINKSDLEKAQFYAQVDAGISFVVPEVNSNLHKKLDLLTQVTKHDSRVADSTNYALHLAITTEQFQYCKQILDDAKRFHIRMNETFLIRAAYCMREDPEAVKNLFIDAGDIYEYRAQSGDSPVPANYVKFADYVIANGICWIAMEYPNRPFSPQLQKIVDRESQKIFTLSNYENFQSALKQHKYDEIFVDRFGGVFGHATKLGNSLIAENVFSLIEKLKQNHECGL